MVQLLPSISTSHVATISVAMSSLLGYISDGIGLVIAVLYTVAGTAHFTDRFTPELAANVETMTQNSSQAFGFLGLSYIQVGATISRRVTALTDLYTAQADIWRVRSAGSSMSVVEAMASHRTSTGSGRLCRRIVRAAGVWRRCLAGGRAARCRDSRTCLFAVSEAVIWMSEVRPLVAPGLLRLCPQ